MGLILLVSEASGSQLKVFLGLIWPTPDSINLVGWPGVHLNPFCTLGMSFGGNNWIKQGFGSLFRLELIGSPDSQEPTEGVFRVDIAST